MPETKGRYLLNTNSKKIHDLENITGRCKIKLMREEYLQYFNTLKDAEAYPSAENPLAKTCKF